jgi:hypothetical protein
LEAKEEVIKEIKQGPNRLETKEEVILLAEYVIMPYVHTLSTIGVNRNRHYPTTIKLPLVTVVQSCPQIEALFLPSLPATLLSLLVTSSIMPPYVKPPPLILIFRPCLIHPPLKLTLRAVVQAIPQIKSLVLYLA